MIRGRTNMSIGRTVSRRRRRRARALSTRSWRAVPTATAAAFSARDEGHGVLWWKVELSLLGG
jgi:hypothetical protein